MSSHSIPLLPFPFLLFFSWVGFLLFLFWWVPAAGPLGRWQFRVFFHRRGEVEGFQGHGVVDTTVCLELVVPWGHLTFLLS